MADEQKVIATRRGFSGGVLREPGDVFLHAGKLGTWMDKTDEPLPGEGNKRSAWDDPNVKSAAQAKAEAEAKAKAKN